ncbi:MAG: DUF488 domain-containing protein, partial [Alphaproteobacteria bacterium]|nr:DUF488 domain-containing protein [Alphaproteobacteria bacterium]
MPNLLTIGYEGTDIATFLTALRASGVEVLADVRELPLSRKPGFSKSALSVALEGVGIRYRHFRELGDPKAGRLATRAGDYTRFRKIFSAHWTAPIEWSVLNVSAWWASGPSGRWFAALGDGIP